MVKFVYEDAFPENPGYPCTYEIWRKDSRTARRHIRQAFGSKLKLKLVSRRVVSDEEYTLHLAEWNRRFSR